VTAIDRARRLPALRACASDIRPLGAGTSLLIGCGCWLHREDFTRRFVITGTSVSDGTVMASIDQEATVGALEADQLPCDGGERRVLRLAASIGRWIQSASTTPFPVSITALAES
jgi:hypothetical protein